MVKISEEESRKADGFELIAVGEYHVVVDEVKDKDGGNYKFSLLFREVGTGRFVCFDTLTFGGAALGIAKKKAIILGALSRGVGEFEIGVEDFKGKTCFLTVEHRLDNKGNTWAHPREKCEGTFFGYAEDTGGKQAAEEVKPDPVGETPF